MNEQNHNLNSPTSGLMPIASLSASCCDASHQTSSTDKRCDPMVCFCYRYTVSALKEARQKYGSLKAVQDVTRVGNGCRGCRASLSALFQEDVAAHNRIDSPQTKTSTCVKPGQKLMTGFVIADGNLESRIVSCNAIAPQLGECDSTTQLSYALLNHKAEVVLQNNALVKTGETFTFDTRKHALPRPFFGTFLLALGRENFGASRFNVQWSNGRSVASTHENAATGRPRVFLPVFINRSNLNGPNRIYLGIMNPRQATLRYSIVVFDKNSLKQVRWDAHLDGYQSSWIDANEILFRPLLDRHPEGNFGIKIESADLHSIDAATVYFFFHNANKDLWSCQHL